MADLVRFNSLAEALAEGVHDLEADTLKVMLTNVAPSLSFQHKSDITEISSTGGYTAKHTTLVTSSSVSDVYTLKLSSVTFLASGGTIGPFRYAVLYNSSVSNRELIGYIDYGSSISLTAGASLVLTFDATNGVLQIS